MFRVSVIVTNYNYGNYLRSALDSVLAQTRPAHELIVVDDGSTDGSRAILESYGERVRPIYGTNRGQAAAFETGFRASTGDIIIFLDADDALKPEAIETLQRVWHPSYAAVCYGMELIDRHGKPCGLYPERTDDFDRRPMLVEFGSFPFMPTSGNAFARRTVERACPFPAERWRLGADAYILRVAAIEGRIFPLSQILACYRVHPGNNYFRVGAPRIWLDRRGNIDIADLAGFFADWPSLGGDPAQQSAERLRLANAAVRTHLTLDRSRRRPGEALRRYARRLATTRDAPLFSRLATAAVAGVLGLGAWRLHDVEDWLRYPHHRPDWLRRFLDRPGYRLRQYLAVAKKPRWRAPTPMGRVIDPVRDPEGTECLAVGWTTPRLSGRATCTGSRAGLSFLVAPTPAALTIELMLACGRPDEETSADVEVAMDGLVLSRSPLEREGSIVVQLLAGSASNGATITLDLRFGASDRQRKGLRLGPVRGLSPPVQLRSFRIDRDLSALDPAGLVEGSAHDFGGFLAAETADWERLPEGGAALVARSGYASLVSTFSTAALIELDLAANQPPGWMQIACGAEILFAGRWGGSSRIWCRLPTGASEGPRDTHIIHHLQFAFTPDDPLEEPGPTISTLTVHSQRSDPVLYGLEASTAPLVNPGQVLTFAPGDTGRTALGKTWMKTEDDIAVLASGEGSLNLLPPPGLIPSQATLAVEPVFVAGPDRVHIVSVMQGNEVLARARIEGDADIAVPLTEASGEVELRLLSLFAETDSAGELLDDAALEPAPLRLRSLSLEGSWEDRPAVRTSRPPFPGHVETLLDADASPSDIAAEFAHADERALISSIASAASLTALTELGRANADDSPVAAEVPATRADRLRAILMAMVLGPAWRLPWVADLKALPEPLLWWPEVFANWLAADPAVLPSEAAPPYEQYLLALLASVDEVVAAEPPGSPLQALARHVFERLRPQQLLFRAGSRREYMERLARTGERILAMDGFHLARHFAPRARDRLRVGILVRNWAENPERRIAEAMVRGLEGSPLDPQLIVQSDRDLPENNVSIANLTVTESVDLIRDLELDVVILGSFFLRFDSLAAIFAHKLAPLQLATAAVSPITTGLSSVDGILSSKLIEPDDAATHYTEPLILVPGPVQAFAPSTADEPDPAETTALARRRLGLPIDDVLLVSGAMMQKIGGDLLEAWASTLAGAPGTRLVLYPFAPNWSVDYAAAAFRERAQAALASKGIDIDRLIILDPLSPTDVRRVLRCCDVYLDSFPYAGAATVTEALEQALPVVSLLGDNQRGRQGAGWLRAFGLDDDIAESVEGYVARATALATDGDLREARRAMIRDRNTAGAPHRDFAAFGATISNALIVAAAAKGVTLNEAPLEPSAYEGPHRYVFHHMPKAGGTSVLAVLKTWFRLHRDYRTRWERTMPRPVNLDGLTPSDLLCGHFELPEARIPARYPEVLGNPEWRLFTFVRDPLELSLSGHFFENQERAAEPGFVPKTLSQRLREDPSDYVTHFGFTPENWREVLDRYWFIGTAERLEESLQYIADELGEPMPDLPLLNATPRTEQPDPADIDTFARRHAFDYEVYNEIRARLDRRLRER